MTEPTADRPRQVTLAGWLIMIGSTIVVVLVFQRVAGLHTLETREGIEAFIAQPPVSDLGIDVDAAITVIRTLAMVTAGCATAAAILGYQVLRRSRSARLALTVLAVPLFLAGLVTGGFLASVVAASAAILWLQPARAWFDGTTPPPRPMPSTRPAAPPRQAGPPRPAGPPRQAGPPRPAGPADSAKAPAPVPAAGVGPPQSHSAPMGQHSDSGGAAPPRRPAVVTWACVLAWVGTAVTVIAMIASGIVLAIEPDRMLDEVHRDNPDLAAQGISDDLLITATYLMIAGIIVWCVAAAVLAVLAARGLDWARIVLIVSACLSGAVCLVAVVVGAVVLVLPLFVSAMCAVLLLRPEARSWFAQRRGSR